MQKMTSTTVLRAAAVSLTALSLSGCIGGGGDGGLLSGELTTPLTSAGQLVNSTTVTGGGANAVGKSFGLVASCPENGQNESDCSYQYSNPKVHTNVKVAATLTTGGGAAQTPQFLANGDKGSLTVTNGPHGDLTNYVYDSTDKVFNDPAAATTGRVHGSVDVRYADPFFAILETDIPNGTTIYYDTEKTKPKTFDGSFSSILAAVGTAYTGNVGSATFKGDGFVNATRFSGSNMDEAEYRGNLTFTVNAAGDKVKGEIASLTVLERGAAGISLITGKTLGLTETALTGGRFHGGGLTMDGMIFAPGNSVHSGGIFGTATTQKVGGVLVGAATGSDGAIYGFDGHFYGNKQAAAPAP